MIRYVAKCIKRYFGLAFVTALVGFLLCNLVYIFYAQVVVCSILYVLAIAAASACVLCSVVMILLFVQTLIVLGTGFGWREKEIKGRKLKQCYVVEGNSNPEDALYRVRVWYGIGIRPIVGRVDKIANSVCE